MMTNKEASDLMAMSLYPAAKAARAAWAALDPDGQADITTLAADVRRLGLVRKLDDATREAVFGASCRPGRRAAETADEPATVGRPRKDTGHIVLFRQNGHLRAWDTRLEVFCPVPRTLPEQVRVYNGVDADWVAWGKAESRGGKFNTVRVSPFRPAPGREPEEAAEFSELYGTSSQIEEVTAALVDLYEGRIPPFPILLDGVWWVRLLDALFTDEAGECGLSRNGFKYPNGKVWASVNCLPTVGGGYNYTEEAWYAVANMRRPPVFCVRCHGSDQGGYAAMSPEAAARCILWGLAHGPKTSCEPWYDETKGLPCALADRALAYAEAYGGRSYQEPEETAPTAPAADPLPAQAQEPADANAGTPDADLSVPEPEEAETTVYEPVAAGEPAQEPAAEAVTPDVLPPEAVEPADEPAPHAEETIPAPAPLLRSQYADWGSMRAMAFPCKALTTSLDLSAPMTLEKILIMATDHPRTTPLSAKCRQIAEKKARNEFKRDNLPVWYPSVAFSDRFKGSVKENVEAYTGLACLDFDGFVSQTEAVDVRDDLYMSFPEVLATAVSASGLGVYALVALDFDGTEAGYRDALEGAFELFESKGYMPDTGCSDPTRARYLSADADMLVRPDGYEPVAIKAGDKSRDILPASLLRQCWTNSGRRRKGAGKEYLKEALNRIAQAPDGMKDTTMTSVMGTVARLIRNYGLDADEVYERVRSVGNAYGYDTKKTEDKIRRLGVTKEEQK